MNIKTWFVLTGVFLGSTAWASDYHIVDVSFARTGALIRTDVIVQDGSNKLNRFGMHRLDRADRVSRGSILLLPSLFSSFSEYTWSDDGDPMHSLASELAQEDYEVWGFSPRTTYAPAADCASHAVDCSAIAGWGIATYTRDIGFIREAIAVLHPGRKPVVGGLSLGAMLTIAAINDAPHGYSAAIVWEGMLYTANADMRAGNATLCQQSKDAMAAGDIFDANNPAFLKSVVTLDATAPNDPSPFPFFPPGTTNHTAELFVFSAPGPVAPAYVPTGFWPVQANFPANQFAFATDVRVAKQTLAGPDLEANAVLRDMRCSLAGDRSFTSHLGQSHLPLLVFEAGTGGFGAFMQDNIALFESSDVETHVNTAYAHADHYVSADHQAQLEAPLFAWLKHHTR